MKNQFKTLVIATAIVVCAVNLSAQRLYVSANMGLGLKLNSQNIAGFYNYSERGSSTTIKQVNVSLGQGFNIGGTVGYMFNNNIGAEMGLSGLIGIKTKATQKSTDNGTSSTVDYAFSGNMFRINPSIVIATGFEKVNPYAKVGIVLGMGSIISECTYNYSGDDVYVRLKYSGGCALGMNAAAGVFYNLNDRLSLFGELNMVNLSYAPTKGKLKKATLDGVDKLSLYDRNEKEFEFVKSLTEDSSFPESSSQPSKQLKEKYPFGSFGLNFGIRIGL